MNSSYLNNIHFRNSPVYTELSKEPLGFIDIGARGGVHGLVDPIAELVSILAFEPDQTECDRIRRELSANPRKFGNFKIESVALGSNNGNATLFQTSTPTNDSEGR